MSETRDLVYYGELDSNDQEAEAQWQIDSERERLNTRAPRRNIVPPKYWRQRLDLFTRFEEGIKIGMKTVLDFYCGVGSHSIQLALNKGTHVIAVDDSHQRVQHALHNARVYGVDESITFVNRKVFDVANEYVKGDHKDEDNINAICVRPPCDHDCDDGDDDGDEGDGLCFDVAKFKTIVELARKITPNVCVIAPRSVHPINVYNNFGPCEIEIEKNYYRGRVKNCSIYFGTLVKPYVDDPDVQVYNVAPTTDINLPPPSTTYTTPPPPAASTTPPPPRASTTTSTARREGSSTTGREANRRDERRQPQQSRYQGLYDSFRHLWQRESELDQSFY